MPFGGAVEGGVAATIFAVTDSLPSKSVGEAVQTITANEIKSEVEVRFFFFRSFFCIGINSTSCDRQFMHPFYRQRLKIPVARIASNIISVVDIGELKHMNTEMKHHVW